MDLSTKQNPTFIFFGTPDFSVRILDILYQNGYIPSLVVTNPDRPKGRKLIPTPPPTKVWAEEHGIPYFQLESMKDNEVKEKLEGVNADIYIVASFGAIIPKSILDIPPHGALNVHTSLLPKFRGASPIESAILAGEEETGSTIIKMDEKMDHGDIVGQELFPLPNHMNALELEEKLAEHGGNLLVKILPGYITGEIKPTPQNHDRATYCGKISKQDAELLETDSDEVKYRKYLAYCVWPRVFYFENGKRIKVTQARFENGKFIIEKIIPEGKREITVG